MNDVKPDWVKSYETLDGLVQPIHPAADVKDIPNIESRKHLHLIITTSVDLNAIGDDTPPIEEAHDTSNTANAVICACKHLLFISSLSISGVMYTALRVEHTERMRPNAPET